MNFLEFLKNNTVVLDGGMGTLLQGAGLGASELPERWSYLHPDVVTDIHKAYFEAGSNVVNTNTFGANLLKLDRAELERIISSSLECARRARDRAEGDAPRFISLDIGPTGRMLKPFGDLDFNECVEIFIALKTFDNHAGKNGFHDGKDAVAFTVADCLVIKDGTAAVCFHKCLMKHTHRIVHGIFCRNAVICVHCKFYNIIKICHVSHPPFHHAILIT